MTDLFLEVLNSSFATSWLVLAVIAARPLLKKAPRWMVCGLWALVAVRLIFGGIEAPFSLLPSDQIIPPESQYALAPAIHSGISSIDNAINPVYSEALRANPTASINPLQVWLAVFANLWILGVGAMSIWAAFSWCRVRQQVRESIPDQDGVFLCDRISSPFIFGLFRPRIYLPSDLADESRAHVIAHERAHLARRDHWWKPLGFVLLTINWFNPLLWLAYILLCRDIEMACDEKVVRTLSAEERKTYSAALLGCSINPRRITACPLAFGEVGVKQRVKSVLNYKKPAFWIILATAVLIALLAASLLTNPLSPKAEIRWDNVLYIQNGKTVKELPADAQKVGILDSPLDTNTHPDTNGLGSNLSQEYADQPLYLSGVTLYLENPNGKGWLPLIPKHSLEDVLDLLDQSLQIDLRLEGSELSVSENIRDYTSKEDPLQIRDALICDAAEMRPSLEWNQTMLAVNYADNITIVISPKDYHCQCTLVRRNTDWLMIYRDGDWAVTAWTFESPKLDEAIKPWQNELNISTELFAPFADKFPIYLDFRTLSLNDIALRMGIPISSFGIDSTDSYWEWQGNASYGDSTMTIRCRPYGRNDWMEIHYQDRIEDRDPSASEGEPIILENGASGTLYHSGDSDRWSEIVLDTTRGQLNINIPNAALQLTDWTPDDYRMALAICGTLSLTENGASLLGSRNPLGITLRMENVTPNGATLVCTQDGTVWDDITTGAPWNLERYEDGAWVQIMPDRTVWTTEAYLIMPGHSGSWNVNWSRLVGTLEPGTYRISKNFQGRRNPMFTLGLEKEEILQTVYAEFTIE